MYVAMVGALAGFLGSVSSLLLNVLGAWMSNIEPLMLLRVYATITQGAAAMDPANTEFFADTLLMHLAAGSLFGAVFLMWVSRTDWASTGPKHVAAGLAFGLLLWLVNFYGVLAWVQPLMVNNIPWWVAALTHVCYGVTLALVSYPFEKDV
jgi:hypothetical protein